MTGPRPAMTVGETYGSLSMRFGITRQPRHRRRIGEHPGTAAGVDPDDGAAIAEPAVPRQADQAGHPLAGIDRIERQPLAARGYADRVLGRRIGHAIRRP